MEIEILKFAKENEQKQNKSAKPSKPPNLQNPDSSTCQEKKEQGKENNPTTELQT